MNKDQDQDPGEVQQPVVIPAARLVERKAELEAELQRGQQVEQSLTQQLQQNRETCLRIQGAIQVLRDELTRAAAPQN